MTVLWIITSVAAAIGIAALAGAVWIAAGELYSGRLARRLRDARRVASATSVLQGLLRDTPDIPLDNHKARTLAQRILLLLEQANVSFRPRWLSGGVCAGAGSALVTRVVFSAPVGVCLFVGLVPPGALVFWVLRRRAQRIRRIREDLPGTFDAVANALRAGQSFHVALRIATDATRPPLKDELTRLVDGLDLAAPLERLLGDFARRVPCSEVKVFVAALRMWRRGGGNLAEILGMVSTMLRERLQLIREVRSLSAEGRLSEVVLIGLPFLALAAVYTTAPDYLAILFHDELGRRLVTVAVFLQLVGATTIHWMVNFNP